MVFQDEKFTEDELAEIEEIQKEAHSRSKLVQQAYQVIKMDSQLTDLQMQGFRDRKRIRELEEQLGGSRKHGDVMGLRQVMLLASSDPEKLQKNLGHLVEKTPK